MKLALDANRYTDFQRGDPDAVGAVRRASEIVLPFIVLGELRAGFRHGQRSADNERRLTEFIGERRVRVIWPDEATTHLYAELWAQLRQAGTPVPTNDLWIAALVLEHGLVLFTRDAHFSAIPRVPRV